MLSLPTFYVAVLDPFEQYTIRFSGLGNGKHRFDFQVDDEFFEKLEYAVVERGDVAVVVELEKTPTLLTLWFEYDGRVEVTCDRCTANWMRPVQGRQRLLIRISDAEEESESEELIYLPRNEYEFNVAQHIYEYIALSVPLRVIPCEDADDYSICDQQVLRLLETMHPAGEEQPPTDSRWDKLKDLGNTTEE